MTARFVFLFLIVGGCLARPQVASEPAEAEICSSCREVVGFVRRLLDTNDVSVVKANLTEWCLSEGPEAPQEVCSHFVGDGIDTLQRVGTDSFCDRVQACSSNSSVVATPLVADNAACDFCVNIVTHVKEIVSAPETETEFKQALQNACKYCPAKDECIATLDKNVDNLFTLLRNKLDPKQVCKSIGYCSLAGQNAAVESDSKPALEQFVGVLPVDASDVISFTKIEPAVRTESNSNPMNCLVCKQVASWAIKKLKDNRTEEAIVQALDEVCDRVFSKGKQTECEAFVKTYTDELISIFKETDDPKLICILLGVCDKAIIQDASPVNDEAAIANCNFCLDGSRWILERLEHDNLDASVSSAIQNVCGSGVIPEFEKKSCGNFVSRNEANIKQVLRDTRNPNDICRKLGVCVKAIIQDASPVNDEAAIANCNFCLDGSRWILDRLEHDNLGDSVSSAIQNLCGSGAIPELEKKSCGNFVSRNEANIKQVLGETRNPNVICRKLELCRRDWIETVEREEDQVQSLPSCFVCKEIAKWVNRQVKQNRTEESIRAALSSVCRVLKNVENCEAKVADWSSRLMIVLKQASEPQLACELLEVCGFPKNQIESEDVSSEKPTGSGTCYECQSIAHFIQEELYSYDKEKRVEDFVISNVCEKIPADLGKETCESFINEYGPSIMQLIAMKAFDPKILCEQRLRFCPKSQSMPASNPQTDIEVSSENTCNLCITSVRELDALLTSTEIDREISTLAAKTCERIPLQDQRQCVTLIEAFGPYFLQMIGRMSDPKQVCRELDLCSEPGEVQLLGGHKCTYGPSYWCHTISHASACRAEDYCRRIWEPIEQTD